MAIHSKKGKAQNEYREALKQSEERFRALIQFSTDAIQLISAEGHVLYSSDSIERVLGYKPEELEGLRPPRHTCAGVPVAHPTFPCSPSGKQGSWWG